MARICEIVDGNLEVTESDAVTVTTLTLEEVVAKKDEAQTIVDHLTIDTAAAQSDVDMWQSWEDSLNG